MPTAPGQPHPIALQIWHPEGRHPFERVATCAVPTTMQALVMGEKITALELAGYSLLLGFFVLYTVVKAHEPKETPSSGPTLQVLRPLLHLPSPFAETGGYTP